MIKNFLIRRYKNYKKQQFLKRNINYQYSYAFIGAGNHSLDNLYPCIQNLGIPLKYICTKDISNAKDMASRFPGCSGTDNLSDILNDGEVKGVFVSTPADIHFRTLKKLFSANKHVFVEKPPCYSLADLKELVTLQQNSICVPGLQRRFCRVNELLNKKTWGASSYFYRYLTGPYPEGNAVFELFIHPVDNLIQLFGPAVIKHISKTKSQENLTVFLLVEHPNGISGCIELSTNYSWNDPVEHLEINNAHEVLKADYPNHLTGVKKAKELFGLPLEKVLKTPVVRNTYLNNNGFSPVGENNSLVIQGFFGEIEFFVKSVETNERNEKHNLTDLLNTYEILEAISGS